MAGRVWLAPELGTDLDDRFFYHQISLSCMHGPTAPSPPPIREWLSHTSIALYLNDFLSRNIFCFIRII